jgi:hypothetical protein
VVHIAFDDRPLGLPPAGFRCSGPGPSGVKPARWEVQADGANRFLVQADGDDTNHRYPVALVEGARYGDVRVQVRAMAVSGARDRSFGIVLRAQDDRTYYLARVNTSEWGANVRFYRFVDLKRQDLGEWQGDIAAGIWHDFAAEMVGDIASISLDGKLVLRVQDATFTRPGLVGVWTKAESVARFDDLVITPLKP